ncbi:bifunctional methylenetetrahydrofolate dehydrogenase/methenyltetrahydrofolate cyclohydrolase FolD [Desulforudis sp. 1088]|jgi:methylenetetrahydrofolate dehydrogenase (NADP+)/methenyltetrahydrofolate cyclohydrolase|uniref:bifunctional methylenetetrahydrofolate dehydrogenase/methenyltetrahydrofolate cyclohydrolase FolD n=1 Tax=unclassified Candidatus Desulforudis TaxID=2635950 RepID=UPI0034769F87
MAARILDGKAIAAQIRSELVREAGSFASQWGSPPGLAVVLVGDNPASQAYVRNKEHACQEVGIRSTVHRLPADTQMDDLLQLLDRLNEDRGIHGVLVQLPLPDHLDAKAVTQAIRPEKDVDGFHSLNVGKLQIGEPCLAPCTPSGVITILERSGIHIAGSHAVVIGRSNIVGKPTAMLLLQRHATVTICHSRTPDLASVTRQADILVVAIGRPGMITGKMVKEGAVVVDVGINRVDGRLVGDVDWDSVAPRVSAITPVPGGVGPMTVTMLLANTILAAKLQVSASAGILAT